MHRDGQEKEARSTEMRPLEPIAMVFMPRRVKPGLLGRTALALSLRERALLRELREHRLADDQRR